MSSVADELRLRTMARVLELSVGERVQLALALGDGDLAAFVRASGLPPDEARRRLRRQRARGRIASEAAALTGP